MTIQNYIETHRERFREEWASLIRIPSVSCQPEHKDDMLRCAERWRELLLSSGAQKAEVMPSQGNPFVYAEYHISDSAPTVLVYAHYDVMPVEPEVSSEAHTFQFNEELPSFNLPNIEMLTVPYDGIAEL